ncbi:MAG: hypothetical protein GY757_52110 [bacterium]|nr:hypothetical protein [bacterium]
MKEPGGLIHEDRYYLYRIVPKNEIDGGYLFLFFRTPHGEVLLKRQASGSGIPRVWDQQMFTVEIPWPPEKIRQRIAEQVIAAHEKIHRALKLQNEARVLVERAIEKCGL